MTKIWVTMGCALALTAFGCSDDETPADGGAGTGGHGGSHGGFDAGSEDDRNKVEPGGICKRMSEIQCAGEAHCCDEPGRTQAECQTAMEKGCTDDLMLDDIAMEAVVGYDAAAAEAAFDEFETLASTCEPGIAAWAISPEGFQGLLAGTVASGGDCTPASDTDLVKVGAALVSCMADGEACMPGTDSWTCTARSAADGGCFVDVNCKDGLYCVDSTCSDRLANGETCGAANECASLACQGDKCVEDTAQITYCLAED